MSNIIKFGASYVMWLLDMAIAFWFGFIARMDLTAFLSLFYKEGNLTYGHFVDFADKAFTIALGLGWLVLMIVAEEYFRKGVREGDLRRRFARFTGPLLVCIFAADLILFLLQGTGSGNWSRWLILAAELGIGIALIVEGNPKLASKLT